MKLRDLAKIVNPETTIWVSTDPSNSEGIYFGQAQNIPVYLESLENEIETIYPEKYPAIYGFTGISIIFKNENKYDQE